MKMIERFMEFLHRPKGPLDFTLGAGGNAAPIFAAGHMGAHLDPEITHHLLKHLASGNGTSIHVPQIWNALKGKTLSGFRGHGGKEKPQRGFDVLSVDAVILLVRDSASVIDHTI